MYSLNIKYYLTTYYKYKEQVPYRNIADDLQPRRNVDLLWAAITNGVLDI